MAKRTEIVQYRRTRRGTVGVKAMKLREDRGGLVGVVVVHDADEVMAIRASGQVTRSTVSGVPAQNRDSMGVKFVDVAAADQVVAIARNDEPEVAGGDGPRDDPQESQ